MILNAENLKNKQFWGPAGISIPRYDFAAMADRTRKSPIWVHFGAGNIFRAFIAALQNSLLNEGHADKGIIVTETFDYEIIDKIYAPHNNLILNATLNSDSTADLEILAPLAESLNADMNEPEAIARLSEIFAAESLQMASFTITEKGYSILNAGGGLSGLAKSDIDGGPNKARHAMGIVAAMLYKRFLAGAYPMALVSMDNCSHNGDKLKAPIIEIAKHWAGHGFVEKDFISYLEDSSKISFPWSMIDKITPRPAKAVEDMLAAKGISNISPIITEKGTYTAAYVNAERPQYLVVEDSFPNGRPALEKSGVYFTTRETVDKVERMKVTTCLNPLHTAMSVYGCLLGYNLICDEMEDKEIRELVYRLGYIEGLPVVTNPGSIEPIKFLDEVFNERLPNPFMPDSPWRIAVDTSQKVGIRFGETIKSYIEMGLNLEGLVSVPLAIAGWFRYLLGVDDFGGGFAVSNDPMKEELQALLKGVAWDDKNSYQGQLRKILSNPIIFGLDLTQTILANKVEAMFTELLNGAGSVRAVLQKYLT
ncbi:MAG: mannitol dehydrogenase family protein [Clostridiales bacterium]|jgi:fructuronate reductase|nr:mannitol dehydrogenase family protein [Clostridiales bacterium]